MILLRNFQILALCSLLAISSACSKKKAGGDNSDGGANINLNKDGVDRTKITFPPGTATCPALYAFLDKLNQNYITEITFDTITVLQSSTQEAAKELNETFGTVIDDIDFKTIKKNDCTVFEKLAANVQATPKILEMFKDMEGFNPYEYVLNGILIYYTNNYDAVSHFRGAYQSGDSIGPTIRWGLRFLVRPDYFGTSKIPERNPPYLYVEYSPSYLREKLPKFTRIYNIDTTAVKDQTFDESLMYLSLKKKVSLTVRYLVDKSNNTYGDYQTINVEFEKVKEPRETSFKIFSTNPNIGYIQIPTFSDPQLEKDYLTSWIEYMQEISGKSDGVILDLRSNGGGSYYLAQKMLGTIFSTDTVIVHRVEKVEGKLTTIIDKAEPLVSINYGKIVVLVDSNSASASEIFASAIQDYSAGLIVGQTTIGKGIGQMRFDIDVENLHGTAAISNFYLFGPRGNSWYFKGIIPDIQVFEPALKDFTSSFADIRDRLPKAYAEKIDVTFSTDAEVRNKLTPETLKQLKDFRNDASNEPAECKSNGADNSEEQSCILAWGYKLLQQWIKIEPGNDAS